MINDKRESFEGFLVRLGKVTPEQIEKARSYQTDAPDQMLVDALVHIGSLDQDSANKLLIAYQAKTHPTSSNVKKAYRLATSHNIKIAALQQTLAGLMS